MNNIFSFMKSTRSLLAVMAMLLLWIVVIGSMAQGQMSPEILAMVSFASGAVITAYFGKRDTPEDQGK